MYNISVIVWDEAKRQSNLRKHGLDFKDVRIISFRRSSRRERRIYEQAVEEQD